MLRHVSLTCHHAKQTTTAQPRQTNTHGKQTTTKKAAITTTTATTATITTAAATTTTSLLRVFVHSFLFRVTQDNLISSFCCIETLLCTVVWDTQLLCVLPYSYSVPSESKYSFVPAGGETSLKCSLVSFGWIYIFYIFFQR